MSRSWAKLWPNHSYVGISQMGTGSNCRQDFQMGGSRGVAAINEVRGQIHPCPVGNTVVSLAGPDVPGKGTSDHYCQHSVDYARMLACPHIAHLRVEGA